jgi:hypothetical protein
MNSLNGKHFLRSTNFKLLKQIKVNAINVIVFKFVIFVKGGLLGIFAPGAKQKA